MAIFQYGSIWFNMCIYNISCYIIYIIQVLFTHEATPNDMAEVQQSIDLGLAPHARSAQSVPSVWRCSHLVEDGVRKTGQVQISKKTKNMTMDQWNPVNTGDGWWWFPSSALAELENQEGFEGSIQSTMGPMGVTWGHLFPACLRDGHEHVTLNHRVPKFQCPPFFTSTVCYSTQKKACLYPPVAIFGQKSIWKNPTWLKDPRLLHSH